MPKIGARPPKQPKPIPCRACEGCGRSSGNTECYPCAGTGVHLARMRMPERKERTVEPARQAARPAPSADTLFD